MEYKTTRVAHDFAAVDNGDYCIAITFRTDSLLDKSLVPLYFRATEHYFHSTTSLDISLI
ncbi:MAG: hypothetical protein ACYS6K_16650 [Planctomycetota bacterium]